MEIYEIIGLACALAYTLGTLCLKRAMAHGVGPWQAVCTCNLLLAPVFMPVFLLGGAPFQWVYFFHAVLLGILFFVGQVLTFFALNKGDVSVANPVLGTKAVWTAIFSALLLPDPLPARIFLASALATGAITLLSWTGGRHHGNLRLGVGLGLVAALLYALVDVMVQRWAPVWGYGRFVPVLFITVSVCSLGLLPLCEKNGALERDQNRAWLWMGSLILGGQVVVLSYAFTTFGHVTVVNILYSTRVLWSVVLVWVIGHWFRNTERSAGHGVMGLRLAGAVLVAVAIFLAVK